MATRASVIKRIAQEVGGYTGTITGGNATTAVLGGLVNTSGDDYLVKGWTLYFPDGVAADQERVVTTWVDSTGTATFATRSDSTPTDEEFVLLPKNSWNASTIRTAIDTVLARTRRTWRTEVILVPGQRSYPLRDIDWLRSRKDIDAVHHRLSHNLLRNEDFAQWQDATIEAWSTTGTVTKATAFAVGDYAATLGAGATLAQDIPLNMTRWIAEEDGSKVLSLAVLARATAAATLRVSVTDGVTTTNSDYHTGGSGLEWLETTHTVSASATGITVTVSGAGTASRCILQRGNTIDESLKESGSTRYVEYELVENTRNVGGSPIIEIPYPMNDGQMLVYSRRAYAVPTTDTETLDIPETVLFHGSLYQLSSIHRRGEDRSRPDRVAAMHGAAYNQLAGDLFDIPVPQPLSMQTVRGA